MTNFSAATAAVGDPVQTTTDVGGLASISGAASGTAPLLDQDTTGRKFLNFRSYRYATIADTLAGMDSQNMAVFLVGRIHKLKTTNIFYPRYQSDGTTANSSFLGALRMSAPTGATTVFPATGANTTNSGNATVTGDRNKMLVGSNMAVIGMVSRTTGNGGTNLIYNDALATSGAQVSARTGMIGAVLGASPAAAGAITQTTNPSSVATNAGFDLYELIVVKSNLTDAQVTAIVAAIRANWSDIATYTDQLVLEGDSITDGIVVRFASDRTGGNESDQCLSMALTEPGALLVPSTSKVINLGTSGNAISNLVTRRDGTITPYDFKMSGGSGNNKVATMIGRNDFVAAITAADHYTNLKSLYHTGSGTGYLERGWDTITVVPIAGSSSFNTDFRGPYRDRIVGTGFAGIVADMEAISAGYGARNSVLRPDLIQVGGATIFEDDADALSLTYYQPSSSNIAVTDTTHPNASAGTPALASGGTTPANGYGGII